MRAVLDAPPGASRERLRSEWPGLGWTHSRERLRCLWASVARKQRLWSCPPRPPLGGILVFRPAWRARAVGLEFGS